MDFLQWLASQLQPAKPQPDRMRQQAMEFEDRERRKNMAREAIHNPQMPSWLKSLYTSPLADSLYAVAGVPQRLGGTQYRSGEYLPEIDLVNLPRDQAGYMQPNKTQSPADQFDPRSFLIHEMGHKKLKPTPDIFQKLAGILNSPPKEQSAQDWIKSTNSLSPYYSKGEPHEMAAQAFNNAFSFLQETAGNPTMDYRKRIGELEGNTPGMGMLVTKLLGEDIFKNHPLRSVFLPSPTPLQR